MPAAVLIRSHGFWCGSVRDAYLMLCISYSHAMHLAPRVCSCCGPWILTVGVGLGLRCWLLADIRPWFGSMFSKFVHWFAGVTVINISYPPLSWFAVMASDVARWGMHISWYASHTSSLQLLWLVLLDSWRVARFGMPSANLIWFQNFEILTETSASDTLKLSLVTTKPVFGVFDQVRLKLACSASETS